METMDFRKDLAANPPVDEIKQLEVIYEKFEAYCTPRKNVTVERFVFHSRKYRRQVSLLMCLLPETFGQHLRVWRAKEQSYKGSNGPGGAIREAESYIA